MSAAAFRSHYIPANHQSRVPAKHIYIDTEAYITKGRSDEIQTWRLGVAAFDQRLRAADEWTEREWLHASTPGELWEWITSKTTEKAQTVVWAHNAGYDLRISQALTELPRLGFALDRLRLGSRDVVARFVSGRRSLVVTDLHSWAPLSLANIGVQLGMDKHDLPLQGASEAEWFARCRQDVDILASAVRTILEWNRANDVGNFQPTGAGQAWATWRHKHYSHKVLVHHDEPARIAEREAVHAGRCEVWRHGRYARTKLHEMDWSTAYAQVCRDVDLPSRLLAGYSRPTLERTLRLCQAGRVLTRIIVRSDTPTLPARVNDRLCWPVGRFVTTVWDNELRAAIADCADVEILNCWVYRSEPVLRQWAQWALSVMADDSVSGGAFMRTVIKQQSRTLIGRFGLRYPEWEFYGDALGEGVDLGTLISPEYPSGTNLLHVGTRLLVQSGMAEGQNAAPQVLGYVMAEVRARLWRWMNAAGLKHVLYVDTDGLILSPKGRANLDRNNPDGLRSKGTFSHGEFRGPRQIVLGGRHRISGVPSDAEQDGETGYVFDAWESLSGGLHRGRADAVRVADRRVQVRGVDYRRVHLNGGFTSPHTVSINEATGANELVTIGREQVA